MKKILVAVLIVSSVLLSGCTQQGTGSQTGDDSETKLTAFQGVGIIDFSVVKNQLPPGSSTYLRLRLRNNALGKTAENVVVSLDGLGMYSLLDCVGKPINPNDFDKYNSVYYGDEAYYPNLTGTELGGSDGELTCGNLYAGAVGLSDELFLYDMDKDLNVLEHGVSKFFKGDEYDFIWGIRAPSSAIISGIYYKQDVYFVVNYDYSSENYFTVTALSDKEILRRRDTGESLDVPVDSSSTAGPVHVSQVYLPVEFPSSGVGLIEQIFAFNIANQGQGTLGMNAPTVLKLEVPNGLRITDNCEDWWPDVDCDSSEFSDFCSGGIKSCNALASEKGVLLRMILPSELVGTISFQVPFEMNSTEIAYLVNNNINIKTYTFKVNMNYTYSLTGSTSIHTRPLS